MDIKNIEIRKLPVNTLCSIINILETNNDWKKVMSVIPKDPLSQRFEPKYNEEDIRIIQKHAEKTKQPCTEILFNEWGTSGMVRPTLSTLKNITIQVQIFRAAEEIAQLLGEEAPQRPSYGPAAAITTTGLLSDESIERTSKFLEPIENEICNAPTKQIRSVDDMIGFSDEETNSSSVKQSIDNKTTRPIKSDNFIEFSTDDPKIDRSTASGFNDHNQDHAKYQRSFPNIVTSVAIESSILHNANLKQFQYEELQLITNNFSHASSNGPSGMSGKVGSGGFADVFVGSHAVHGLLAIKKLHMHGNPDTAMKVFNAEVKILSQSKHVNIVPIIGFSIDGPAPCIVCKYMEGGSLQNKIALKTLSEEQRIDIMIGTAEGLKYLHTSDSALLEVFDETNSQNFIKNFVHGDVKTANILLTTDCVPKLCDFGLARQYDTTHITTSPMGTSVYMAPEGIHGTITQKADIFSFGIVLLELLTGLGPLVIDNGEKLNIKDYIEENADDGDITKLLDPLFKSVSKAKDIYKLVQICLERERRKRPPIEEVCDRLYKIRDN